jgi:hypothetical protein
MNRPAGAPMPGNAVASGWIPQSPLQWLEELRDEHERLVSAWKLSSAATKAVGRAQADLRGEYDGQVAAAARAGKDPPAVPGRLDRAYVETQFAAAAEGEAAGRAELDGCVARVASAVGAHRFGEEWQAATTVEEDVSPGDPRVAVAARLIAFEGNWVWPPVWVPGPSVEELEAEVAAATEDLQRLTADANRELRAYDERATDAYEHGAPRPAPPDLDDELMARSHAMSRLERAIQARDKAARRGGRLS